MSYRENEFIEMQQLHAAMFQKLIDDFPEVKKSLEALAEEAPKIALRAQHEAAFATYIKNVESQSKYKTWWGWF